MFHRRSSEFEPRIAAITDHLRGIRMELGAIGDRASQNASSATAAAVDQIADAIRPVLQDIEDRLRAGQRRAVDRAAVLANEALRSGSDAGRYTLERVGEQTEEHPFAAIAIALGVGFLIGVAAYRASR
jgi:ElaB/YqjD/DUF883 family membrane-anchored ribosome-binding protein